MAKCEDRKPGYYKGEVRANAIPEFPDSPPMFGPELNYSTDWAQAGPIIEREEIDLKFVEEGVWQASNVFDDIAFHHFKGPTPLIAAMRCYVASKLGDEIEIPESLSFTDLATA